MLQRSNSMLTDYLTLWDCHIEQDSHFVKCHELQYVHPIECYELANSSLPNEAKQQNSALSYHQPG